MIQTNLQTGCSCLLLAPAQLLEQFEACMCHLSRGSSLRTLLVASVQMTQQTSSSCFKAPDCDLAMADLGKLFNCLHSGWTVTSRP